MAQPYVGEIRLFAGNFAPAGWQFCNGQLLPISENQTLFQLIGTTYGGDGQSTFALPQLQSRVPIHMGTGKFGTTYSLADAAGTESVTLTVNQIPVHTHPLLGTMTVANDQFPANNVLAQTGTFDGYQSSGPGVAMASQSVNPDGGSQPHTNIQPFLCINFIISLFGIFPSQT
jgi:microcystin-dependent protein